MTQLIVLVAVLLAMVGLTPCTEGTERRTCPKVFSYPNPCNPKLSCQTDIDCTTIKFNKSCCPQDLSCDMVCRKPHVLPDDIPINLILMVDIRNGYKFKERKALAKRLIDHFDISEKGTHVAILSFSGNDKNKYRILRNFDETTCPGDFNAVNIKLKIENLQATKFSSRTSLHLPLEKVRDEILTKIPDERKNYKTVLVSVLGGSIISTNKGKLETVSREIKESGVEIVASCISHKKTARVERTLLSVTSQNHIFFLLADRYNYQVFKAVKDVQQRQRKACSLTLDLVLVIERSKRFINKKHLQKMIDIASYLTTSPIISKDSRIAVIGFSRVTTDVFDLPYNSYPEIEERIEEIPTTVDETDFSRIDLGLDRANEIFNRDFFKRKSMKVCLVFTSGNFVIEKGEDFESLEAASKQLKDKGVHVFALGFGYRQKRDNLKKIASPGNIYVPEYESFGFLDSVINGLQCGAKGNKDDESEGTETGNKSDEDEEHTLKMLTSELRSNNSATLPLMSI